MKMSLNGRKSVFSPKAQSNRSLRAGQKSSKRSAKDLNVDIHGVVNAGSY